MIEKPKPSGEEIKMAGLREACCVLIAVSALGLVVSACQTSGPKSVSLDEAKKITAEFNAPTFKPPPRSTADVMAFLEQKFEEQEASSSFEREAAQELLAKEPPPGLSGTSLAEFYRDRALAARQIGDVTSQIRDFQEAVDLTDGEISGFAAQTRVRLALAQLRGGNILAAIQSLSDAISVRPDNKRGAEIVWSSLRARWYARIGDLPSATASLRISEGLLEEAEDWRSWNKWGATWTYRVEKARAALLQTEGRYREAEALYRTALERGLQETLVHPVISKDHTESSDRRDLSVSLMLQGRLSEAEAEARQALFIIVKLFGRNSTYNMSRLRDFGRIVGNQGRFDEAAQIFQIGLDIYQKLGVSGAILALGETRQNLAEVLINQGRWDEAAAQYELIEQNFAESPEVFERAFATSSDWALALLKSGRVDAALSRARRSAEVKRSSLGPKHYDTAYAMSVLAMAEAASGDRAAALAGFAQALPVLLSRSRQSVGSEGETQAGKAIRQRLIPEAYIDLLAAGGSGDAKAVAETFRLADTVRGRTVMRAVAASGARSAIKDPAGADLVRREQDAQKQISALY
ncbi:MAG: tetratricopeptide repeat protein, partial [Alphaproteobacteria bacterium]|nr:tetratricopeptide repeat protein [Alphaproteobacteria bacterium]